MVKCNEALREVTLAQSINGKQFGRTYHFDKVGRGGEAAAGGGRLLSGAGQWKLGLSFSGRAGPLFK